jgi:hypothetical protein
MGKSEILKILEWFARRGFELQTHKDSDGNVWADLVGDSTGKVVAPRYGKGKTEAEAVRRARERFRQEQ